MLIEPVHSAVGALSEGLVAVLGEAGWGYFDPRGREVIAPRFDEAGPFREGLALVREGGFHGYVDRAGAWFWKAEAEPPGMDPGLR